MDLFGFTTQTRVIHSCVNSPYDRILPRYKRREYIREPDPNKLACIRVYHGCDLCVCAYTSAETEFRESLIACIRHHSKLCQIFLHAIRYSCLKIMSFRIARVQTDLSF